MASGPHTGSEWQIDLHVCGLPGYTQDALPGCGESEQLPRDSRKSKTQAGFWNVVFLLLSMKWRLSAWKITPGSIGEEDEALYLFKNVCLCACVHVCSCAGMFQVGGQCHRVGYLLPLWFQGSNTVSNTLTRGAILLTLSLLFEIESYCVIQAGLK